LSSTCDDSPNNKTDSIKDLASELKKTCELIREEFDDHLQAINDNTTEQQIQNSHICEIDHRITKIEERMDEIHHMLRQMITKSALSVEMSKDEQKVFLLLYTHDKFITPKEISARLTMEQALVEDALDGLMDKGIPMERELIGGKIYIKMDKDFKLRQAKENIVKIDSDVTKQYQNALLKQFFEA
jgi:predicted transcriptional regulator